MTPRRKADRPVNRLLDIVVEEVSLVDRAANEHRFLIVKRDTPMADTQTDTDAVDEAGDLNDQAAAEDTGAAPYAAPGSSADPLLTTAVAALEGLTSTVELLGSLGADQADARLAPLAAELKATAEALLARAGGAPPEASVDVESTERGEDDDTRETSFEAHLAAAREALAQLASLSAAKPPPAPSPAAPAPELPKAPALPQELTASLAAMTESFRALAETVKEQQQRLARVEKQFGLPNSAPSTERVRKAEPEEVGWPMDLNHPMDRESVDKAVSFHDL
ncbi:MAG: hypothetical protein KF901_32335 [Myxococcales bacterium]|nr:hypothetical protein [Myxococcales bacterium]